MRLLKGIDVSDAQGTVDWAGVKAAGTSFAFVKATEGGDWTSRLFTTERVRKIHEAGLAFGAYHYLRPRRSRQASVEAKHFVDVVTAAGWRAGRDLPLVVDCEWIGNEAELSAMTGARMNAYVSDFCGYVHERTGRGCVVYMSPAFAVELGNKAPTMGGATWVADWDAPDGQPRTPKGFLRRLVLFHQTSDRAHVPGVPAPVDLNVFLGDARALKALIQGKHQPLKPPAPTPKPPQADRLTTKQAQMLLRRIGWPIKVDGVRGPRTIGAVMDFQGGYARGQALSRTGVCDARTTAALRWSATHDGRCSEHFTFREFRSKKSGTCHGDSWIKVSRGLVLGLEAYRRLVGGPVAVVSGYRDPWKNTCEGGASSSQHMYGNAADLVPVITVARARSLRAFSGIGFQGASGLVRHLDVRHEGPNTTGGTTASPTTWRYS